MAGDGTMAGIYFRWFHQSNNDALTIDLMEQAKRRSARLTVTAVTLFLILGGIYWQYRRPTPGRGMETERGCGYRAAKDRGF